MSLSAINHKRLDSLNEITGNYNKATLLDKLLFWWQHSTYTLNDNQKWFTRSVSRISKDSGIAKRSVERYMSQFEKMGLIEKRCVLLRKKNLYIRITEKLLTIINHPLQNKETTTQKEGLKNNPESSHLNQNGGNDAPKMALSHIRSKDSIIKNNSTVSQEGIVNNSDELIKKPNNSEQTTHTDNSGYKIEKVIGERITDRFKNYVKGVMSNLQIQHNLQFSNPEKLFAEIIFSVTNTDNQFQGIDNAHHRMNIIAKLLREKRWKTPKGFYNHWDVGQVYKEREDVKQRQYQALKQEEGVSSTGSPVNGVKPHSEPTYQRQNNTSKSNQYEQEQQNRKLQAQLNALQREIQSETHYLEQARGWFTKKVAGITESFIDGLEQKIAHMYENLMDFKLRLDAT